MTMPSTGELIKSGRAFVAKRWGFILVVTVGVPTFISVISEIFGKTLEDSFLALIVNIVVFALSLVVSLGTKRITLDLVDEKPSRLADLFSQTNLFWKFLWASIIYGIIVVIGFILLIIPGIYLSLKYGFFGYILVDRPELSAGDVLKESARLTDGIKWNLFWFSVALIGINILGLMALGIGLLYTIPVSIMAYTALYRALTRSVGSGVTSETPETPAVSVPMETPVA